MALCDLAPAHLLSSVPCPNCSQMPAPLALFLFLEHYKFLHILGLGAFPVMIVYFPRLLQLSDMNSNIAFSQRLSLLFFLDSSHLILDFCGYFRHRNSALFYVPFISSYCIPPSLSPSLLFFFSLCPHQTVNSTRVGAICISVHQCFLCV